MIRCEKGEPFPQKVFIQDPVLVAVEDVDKKLVLFIRIEPTIRSPHDGEDGQVVSTQPKCPILMGVGHCQKGMTKEEGGGVACRARP